MVRPRFGLRKTPPPTNCNRSTRSRSARPSSSTTSSRCSARTATRTRPAVPRSMQWDCKPIQERKKVAHLSTLSGRSPSVTCTELMTRVRTILSPRTPTLALASRSRRKSSISCRTRAMAFCHRVVAVTNVVPRCTILFPTSLQRLATKATP